VADPVHRRDTEEEAIVVEVEVVPSIITETVIATGTETGIATEIVIEGTTTAITGMITTGETTEGNGGNVLALPALAPIPRHLSKTKKDRLLNGRLV